MVHPLRRQQLRIFSRLLPLSFILLILDCDSLLSDRWATLQYTTLQSARSSQLTQTLFPENDDTPDNSGGGAKSRPYRAQELVRQGMEVFRQGKINESIDFFDQAATNRPSIIPYLWQRGLSYYYADRFQEAAQQFQTDVKVNPLDVEEIVWDIASQWRLDPQKGPRHIMALPVGMKDRRPIMV
jgi:tetratricopeptide (TPR) repeat protein